MASLLSRRYGLRLKSIEDRLHRERGKQHAEHPHDHLARGHADQLMDLLGEQEQHQGDRHHRQDGGDDRAEQLRLPLVLAASTIA